MVFEAYPHYRFVGENDTNPSQLNTFFSIRYSLSLCFPIIHVVIDFFILIQTVVLGQGNGPAGPILLGF